ncbi:MAG: LPS assembly lipoprotein LptE [Planctomycetota bacterium]
MSAPLRPSGGLQRAHLWTHVRGLLAGPALARADRRRWGRAALTALTALAACAVVLSAGCGYSAGLTPRRASGAAAARIGIEVFDNQSREPDLERALHAALSDATRRWVDARLVVPSEAEVVVRGRILDVRHVEGIRSSGNRPLESGTAVQVTGELFDVRRGTVVRRAEASVRVGSTLDVADGALDARQRAVEVAAERLVLLLMAVEDEAPQTPLQAASAP